MFRATSPAQAFKATIFLHKHSEPPPPSHQHLESSLSQASRATSTVLSVQSHHFLLQAFKATLLSSIFFHRCSKPSSQVGVQSHRPLEPLIQLKRSEPLSLYVSSFQSHHQFSNLGVQSHHFSSQVFKATTTLTLAFKAIGLQSHFSHRFSEPPFPFIGVQSHLAQFYFLSQAFKAIGLQSHFSNSSIQSHSLSTFQAFKATINSPTQAFRATIFRHRCSRPPPLSHWHSNPQGFKAIRLQSHSSHRHSKPQAFKAIPSIGFQSHHFLLQVFRATLLNSIFFHRRSKPLSQIGIQSHKPSEPLLQLRNSKPFSLHVSGFQSHDHFSNLDVQSHFSVQEFRATIFLHRHSEPPCSFRRLEPSLLVYAFRAICFSLGMQCHDFRHLEPSLLVLGIQRHFLQFRHSKPPCLI